MKHKVGFNPLGRKTSHRKALHRNMVTSLFRYERITTTKAKARAIRRTAEKMITRAKVDSVHNRRTIAESIWDKGIIAKLFTELGPRFETRPGGYTRMLKVGMRQNDAAEMVILELVSNEPEAPADKKKAKASKSGSPKAKPEKPKVDKTKSETKPSANTATEATLADESATTASASVEENVSESKAETIAEGESLEKNGSQQSEDSSDESDA